MWDKGTSHVLGASVELIKDGLEAGRYGEPVDVVTVSNKTTKRSKKSKKEHTLHLEDIFQKLNDKSDSTIDSVKEIIERVAIAPIQEPVQTVQPFQPAPTVLPIENEVDETTKIVAIIEKCENMQEKIQKDLMKCSDENEIHKKRKRYDTLEERINAMYEKLSSLNK